MHLCLTEGWADGVNQRTPYGQDCHFRYRFLGLFLSLGLWIGSAVCVATKDEILRARKVVEATVAPNQTHTQNDRNSCEEESLSSWRSCSFLLASSPFCAFFFFFPFSLLLARRLWKEMRVSCSTCFLTMQKLNTSQLGQVELFRLKRLYNPTAMQTAFLCFPDMAHPNEQKA